jgi:hypothetical protein
VFFGCGIVIVSIDDVNVAVFVVFFIAFGGGEAFDA